jgi:hypothetical protein
LRVATERLHSLGPSEEEKENSKLQKKKIFRMNMKMKSSKVETKKTILKSLASRARQLNHFTKSSPPTFVFFAAVKM